VEGCTSTITIDRRSRVRYPVGLDVRYRTTNSRHDITGVGRTLNISSTGLLVTCQHEFSVGTRLEVQIDWPTLLDSMVGLKLVAVGRVVRSQTSIFAMEMSQHEFRTRRRTQQQPFVLQQSA
jgi:hypothetical protein